MEAKDFFINYLKERDIPCSDLQYAQMIDLMLTTFAMNEKFNLTAITNAEDFEDKMLIDSALGMYDVDLTDKKVIDVGTGAGFPGLVLYILNKKMHLTLLDSTSKKIDHLRRYCSERKYHDIKFINERAEEFSIKNVGTYDYAYARAVAHLRILIETIMPMLKVGGTLVALKGKGYEDEILQSEDLMKKIGCKVDHIYEDKLPISEDPRFIIHIKKVRKTPEKFPRLYSTMKKEIERLK